jgi:hypothetical protein
MLRPLGRDVRMNGVLNFFGQDPQLLDLHSEFLDDQV